MLPNDLGRPTSLGDYCIVFLLCRHAEDFGSQIWALRDLGVKFEAPQAPLKGLGGFEAPQAPLGGEYGAPQASPLQRIFWGGPGEQSHHDIVIPLGQNIMIESLCEPRISWWNYD